MTDPVEFSFNARQLDIIREWFDSTQDLNPKYLEEKDYVLADKIYRCLGRRVPHSVSDKLPK